MMDEKEQAWLRLKAFKLVTKGWHERDADLVEPVRVADALYQWAVTGTLPDGDT